MRKNSRLQRLLCTSLLLFPLLSGCQETNVLIEKKTLVISVPEDSKEIRLLCVFEGIPDKFGWNEVAFLMEAKGSIFYGLDARKFRSLGHFHLDGVRFYRDFTRYERRFCAYRTVSIADREEFAKQLNEDINQQLKFIGTYLRDSTLDHIRQRINSGQKYLAIFTEWADKCGTRALLKTGQALLQLLAEFDEESFRKFGRAVEAQNFRWIRFEPDTMSVCFPITPECAKRIMDPKKNAALEEMRSLVKPLQVKAADDGLTLILGEKGKAIRFESTDPRPEPGGFEGQRMKLELADNPAPLSINGKRVGTEKLIETFQTKAAWDAFRAKERPHQKEQEEEYLERKRENVEFTAAARLRIAKRFLWNAREYEAKGKRTEAQASREAAARLFQEIIDMFPDTKAAQDAREPAKAERRDKAASRLQIAKKFLQDAQNYEAKGKRKEAEAGREIAAHRLQEVIDMFPDTKAAEEARGLLQKLKKAGR